MSSGDHNDPHDPPEGTPDGATVVAIRTRKRRGSSRAPARVGNPVSSTSGFGSSRSAHSGATPSSYVGRADLMADVLLGDELTRAHGFSGAIAAVSGGVLVALPLLGGHAVAKLACAVALLWICLSSVWVFQKTRPGCVYDRVVHRVYGFTITTGVLAVEYYCGMFSPVSLIVTLGVYFLGQSADSFQARGLTTYVSVSYVLCAVLITCGVVPDVGLFNASESSLSSHVFAIVAVTVVLAVTVTMARVSRASMRVAIERSNDAMLTAQNREALLLEAQQHLERALHVAVGKPSTHTGQLAGSYRLGIVVGVGAMGEIYEAQREPQGTPAAVKLMHAGMQERDDLVQRFLREAEICQRLDNPHVVRVFEAGTMADGLPFMAMELLQGTDLAAHLRKHGAMSLSDVVLLARELSEGLSHAHAAGVVHRDLKPVNVFLAHDSETGAYRWKVLDFGISKLVDSTGTLTNVGIVGTPGYMSPEQAQGHAVDVRSDVFSMCVVLYRALTGRPAFTGNDTPQIMFEVVYKSPVRPSSLVEVLPFEVDVVLAIGLAKDPGQRWSTPTQLAEALELAAQGKTRSEWKSRARKLLKQQPWGQTVKAAQT